MADYIRTVVSIQLPPKQLWLAVSKLLSRSGWLDFNVVLPQPTELDIPCNTNILSLAKQLRGGLPASECDEHKLVIALKCNDNIDKYGHPTWYEWRYANWGTKSNAYEQEWPIKLQHTSRRGNYAGRFNRKRLKAYIMSGQPLQFAFETAWAPPTPIIKLWSKRNPGVTFNLEYYEECESERYRSEVYLDGELTRAGF